MCKICARLRYKIEVLEQEKETLDKQNSELLAKNRDLERQLHGIIRSNVADRISLLINAHILT